jgi:hypothetical protein
VEDMCLLLQYLIQRIVTLVEKSQFFYLVKEFCSFYFKNCTYSYTLHGSRQTLTQEAKDRGKAVLLTPHIRPRRGRRALLRPRQMMRAELRYAGPETTGQGLPAVFALEPAQSVVDVGREGVALLYPAACSFSAAPPLRGRVSHLPSPLLALHQSSTSCAALNVRDRLPKNNRTFGLGCEIGRDLSPGTRLFEPRPND